MSVIADTDSHELDVPEVLSHIQDTDIIRSYILKAARYALLNAQQEVELAQQIEVGVIAADRYEQMNSILSPELLAELEQLIAEGATAKEMMTLSNLGLVMSEARSRSASGVDFIDLVQFGNIALMHAVEMFDYTKGYKFSTYATPWIKRFIHNGIADTSRTIRVPTHLHDFIGKVYKAQTDLQVQLRRQPSEQEIADNLKISVKKVRLCLQAQNNLMSLDMPIGDGDGVLGDIVGVLDEASIHAPVENSELAESLYKKLDMLTHDERQVLTYRFGLFGTEAISLLDIAKLMDMKMKNLINLLDLAMSKLRHPALKVDNAYAQDQGWREDALCAEVGLDLFYPERGGSTRLGQIVCAKCDVRSQCLDYALNNEEKHGIWGGESTGARRKKLRQVAEPEDN